MTDYTDLGIFGGLGMASNPAEGNGVAAAKPKFKRKSDVSPEEASPKAKKVKESAAEKDKRAKTPRACDSCRRKKIRCDVIQNEPPLCKHCKAHNFECTWFLPITETRWKKTGKPLTQAEQAAALANAGTSDSPAQDSLELPSPVAVDLDTSTDTLYFNRSPVATRPPPTGSFGLPSPAAPSPSLPALSLASAPATPAPYLPPPTRPDPRLLGPTSISHIMHSTAIFPVDLITNYNNKYCHAWDVRESGDGFIKVFQKLNSSGSALPTVSNLSNQTDDPMAITTLSASTIESLVNQYFSVQAPLFPVLSRADFLATSPLEPMLLWTICGVAAMTTRAPSYILRSIKQNFAAACKETDSMEKSTLQSVQALLIFGASLEVERPAAGTKVWNAVGLAIRQAQDLGLHRETDTALDKQTDPHHVELKRRIWGGCIIADRWVSALYGLPMMIDISDCDRLYPSIYEYLPGQPTGLVDMNAKPFLGNASMIELSLLLGNVLKLLYTPAGITHVTDDQLHALQRSIDKWLADLPEELKFTDPNNCSVISGFLHMAYVPVRFLSLRPFMRLSYAPENVKFYATLADFTDLAARSRKAIDWIDRQENINVLEGWAPMPYSLFICALIQYHLNVRRRDAISLASLRQARDVLKRATNEECVARSRIHEVVAILEHTAVSLLQGPPVDGSTARGAMNPTAGSHIRNRDPRPQWDEQHQVYRNGLEVTPGEPPVPKEVMLPSSTNGAAEHPHVSHLRTARSDNSPASGSNGVDSPNYFSDDPNAIFTFAPGSDFVAPGSNDGPLAFDLPDFIGDQSQWSSWLQSMGVPADFAGAPPNTDRTDAPGLGPNVPFWSGL